jgi:hypothetical protein
MMRHDDLVRAPSVPSCGHQAPRGSIAPLWGKRVARHAADDRVRDEMTLA